jgi:hypothetical protein
MRGLFLFLLLGAGAVQAQTINLNPAGGLGALHQYHDVTTDAVPDDPVTMSLPQSSGAGNMQLWFDSEAGDPSNYTSDNYHWTGYYVPGAANVLQRFFCSGPLIDRGGYYSQDCIATGEQLTLTINESVRTVRGSGSGRGGYASKRLWTLLGGTIVK